MKIVKLLFLSVCGLFAIAAAAVAVLLFSPSIQTKIANSVYPDFSAESVSIGLSGYGTRAVCGARQRAALVSR